MPLGPVERGFALGRLSRWARPVRGAVLFVHSTLGRVVAVHDDATVVDLEAFWRAQAQGNVGKVLKHDGTQFVLAASAASGTVTRAAATASGTENVAHGLGVIPAVMWFIASDDATAAVNSNGWAHAASISAFTGSHTVASRSGLTTCVNISTSIGDGHNANVSAVDATNFTLNWTKVGNGRAITVKWAATA